jgi:hypothetical protein
METLFKDYIEKYALTGGHVYFDLFLKIKPDANYVYFETFQEWFFENKSMLLEKYSKIITEKDLKSQEEFTEMCKNRKFKPITLEDFENRGGMFDTIPLGVSPKEWYSC